MAFHVKHFNEIRTFSLRQVAFLRSTRPPWGPVHPLLSRMSKGVDTGLHCLRLVRRRACKPGSEPYALQEKKVVRILVVQLITV